MEMVVTLFISIHTRTDWHEHTYVPDIFLIPAPGQDHLQHNANTVSQSLYQLAVWRHRTHRNQRKTTQKNAKKYSSHYSKNRSVDACVIWESAGGERTVVQIWDFITRSRQHFSILALTAIQYLSSMGTLHAYLLYSLQNTYTVHYSNRCWHTIQH